MKDLRADASESGMSRKLDKSRGLEERGDLGWKHGLSSKEWAALSFLQTGKAPPRCVLFRSQRTIRNLIDFLDEWQS